MQKAFKTAHKMISHLRPFVSYFTSLLQIGTDKINC